MDSRVYRWLSDYADMLQVTMAMADKPQDARLDEVLRINIRDVREYLAQWQMTPPETKP